MCPDRDWTCHTTLDKVETRRGQPVKRLSAEFQLLYIAASRCGSWAVRRSLPTKDGLQAYS